MRRMQAITKKSSNQNQHRFHKKDTAIYIYLQVFLGKSCSFEKYNILQILRCL